MLICPLCETVYPDGSHERCPNDQTPLYIIGDDAGVRTGLQVGDSVAGKYTLLEEMERRQGAGRTFKARQVALDRLVELRVLPENSIERPSDHARFQREVATWGKLRSDNLVRLYDSGFTEGNSPYMALEYVGGGSLGEWLRNRGPLPIPLAETVARHMLSALSAAHAAAVLHRDITPDAIVLEQRADGRPHCRLTGFGLAKHLGDDDDDPTAITMTGQVVGNPAYMAPETIMQGILDPRTDLYALGVSLYELITGRRPFPGESLAQMLAAHVQGSPVPMGTYRPDVTPVLRAFVERLLVRDPAARFQSAGEALAALDAGAAVPAGLPDLSGGLGTGPGVAPASSGGWATPPQASGPSGQWGAVPPQARTPSANQISGGWPAAPQQLTGGWPAAPQQPASGWAPTDPGLAAWPQYTQHLQAIPRRKRRGALWWVSAILGAMIVGGLLGLALV